MTPQNKLDTAIAELEGKLAKLKAVRNALDDDQISAELLAIFGAETNGQKKRKRPIRILGRETTFDRIRQLFSKKNNEWMTLAEIEQAGINKATARQVLYVKNVPDFERESLKGGGRETKFRLRHPERVKE